MGLSIGVDYFSSSHIELSKGKVITARVELVLKVLQGVDSLCMVEKCSQMKLLASLNDFYFTALAGYSHYTCIPSQTYSTYVISKGINFPEHLPLTGVIDT